MGYIQNSRLGCMYMPSFWTLTKTLGHLPLEVFFKDGLSSRVHALDDKMIKNHLLLGTLQDVLLNAILRHQPVDAYLATGYTTFRTIQQVMPLSERFNRQYHFQKGSTGNPTFRTVKQVIPLSERFNR